MMRPQLSLEIDFYRRFLTQRLVHKLRVVKSEIL